MRHYERYLFSNLLWPTVLITVSLTGIVWLTQVLRFLDFILTRGLSLGDFMYLTGLMLPSLLLILMPVALSIAVIYTYNKLTSESELIVLNAVGVSKWQLARPALLLGVICMVICYALALFIMPESNRRFRDIRTLFRDKYASVLLEEQVFNSPMDGVTVYVRSRDADNNLSGVLMHDSRNPNGVVSMIAERGRVEQTASGPKFYLQQGMRQEWKNGRISWLAFDDYSMEIAFYGKAGVRSYSPEEQNIIGLYKRDGLTDKQQRAYRAEANQRILWPLFTVALPLFVIAALFSSEFNRRGQSKRMIMAAVGMALIVIVYFSLRNLTVKYGALTPMLYVLVLTVTMASAYVLMSARMLRMPSLSLPMKREA